MSERYTRVFSLPENLYATGSPVVISAGALLKDNQTGKVLAQLKLTNIQYKEIKAVKVKLFPQDTMGQPLGEAIDYQYLDLQLTRDGDFGAKTPIPFPDATTRAFAAEVTSVVFSDNTAWNSDGSPWEPIPASIPLHRQFDNLVIEQLRLEQSGTCQFVVQAHKDLWLCTCGAVNHDGEVRCHNCGKQLSQIYPLDVAGLTERANLRLAEEAQQAAEERAEREAALAATKKKTAKTLKIVIPALCAVAIIALLLNFVIIPNIKYNSAVSLMEAGQYEDALAAFEDMDGYKDSAAQIAKCEDAIVAAELARIEAEQAAAYADAEKLAANGELANAAIAFGKLGDYQDSRERSFAVWKQVIKKNTIVASSSHTVGIKRDGTVVAVGSTDDGRCNVSRWENVIAISSINGHAVGLKNAGTTVAVGKNDYNQCAVSGWEDIVAIATGASHTVGLKNDGTLVAIGYNDDGRCDVSNWTNIVGIAAGYYHTVGLKNDGTVVTVGTNNEGQCDVSTWRDIAEIFAGGWHTIGLRSDGTVIAVGCNDNGRCDVSDWSDIVSIAAGRYHTVGLKSDGTVVAVGQSSEGQCDVSDWNDIVAISAGAYHTVGLKSDGTMVAVGWNEYGQCNVSKWKDIKLPN